MFEVSVGGYPPGLIWFYNFYKSVGSSNIDSINQRLSEEPITVKFVYDDAKPRLVFDNEDDYLAFRLRWA